MARAVQATSSENTIGTYLARWLREVSLWMVLFLAIFLLLALATYSPQDPAWWFVGPNQTIRNAGGRAGALLADGAFALFGLCAYLFPLMLGWTGFLAFRYVQPSLADYVRVLSLRWIGFLVTLLAATGLAQVHLASFGTPLKEGAGGVLGKYLSEFLVAQFSSGGGSLFLLALVLSGFTLVTGLSWLAVMDGIGAGILAILGGLRRVSEWLSGAGSLRAKAKAPLVRAEPSFDLGDGPVVARAEIPVEPFFSDDDGLVLDEVVRASEPMPPPAPTMPQPPKAARPAPPPAKPVPVKTPPPRVAPVPVPRPLVESPAQTPLPDGDDSLIPPISLLDPPETLNLGHSDEALEQLSREVELKLKDFGVAVQVVGVYPGPVVTLFELQLAPGTKVSKITGLAKDLARALLVISVRVVEVIPGKSVIGLEVPNEHREMVYLSEVFNSPAYGNSRSPLTLALGKDISGRPSVVDLESMPHALIAGTTGSGKSVAVNAMILSLLYKSLPQDVRLIMIDPKMLELSVYQGIPHLLTPVVTDMKEAANALRWCVGEMERRYKLMASLGVRNIKGYNKKVEDAELMGRPLLDPFHDPNLDPGGDGPQPLKHLPYVVVIIDELADMMMVVGKKVEELIARLAQKARASGIHLLLATQRPSVDVLTGLIKANIPTRIAFQVSSRIDSRTVLDQMGAEHLLGHGDMLYLDRGKSIPQRVHGAFVADHEVHKVVDYLKARAAPDYIDSVREEARDFVPGIDPDPKDGDTEDQDPLFDEAVRLVTEKRRASISSVQRQFKIGYNRAARLVEEMERIGIVGPQESNGNREVLAPPPPED